MLKDRISRELKVAMKAQDKKRVSVLRMLLSEIKYAQTALQSDQDLSDQDVLRVIQSYHKRLTKSLSDFPEGEKYREITVEISIIEEYLPSRPSAEVVDQLIEKVVSTSDDRSFGPLMKQLLTELGAGADGNIVSKKLKEKLASV